MRLLVAMLAISTGLLFFTTPAASASPSSAIRTATSVGSHQAPASVSGDMAVRPDAASFFTLSNAITSRCLDDSLAYGVRSFGCNQLSYQYWSTYHGPAPWNAIWNQNTGRCLDDSFAYGLRTLPCNGLTYQGWEFVPCNSYGFGCPIKNQNTGRCLDDSYSYGLRSFPCNGLTYQDWIYH